MTASERILTMVHVFDGERKDEVRDIADEVARMEDALERIAAGNPAPAGKWLSDIEMASIARDALGKP